MDKYQIAVIGAGASGLMAAYTAARRIKQNGDNGKVVLLEGNSKAGKKLLATGNGRCNLTNKKIVVSAYHGDRNEIGELIAKYDCAKITDAFAEMGLLTMADSNTGTLIYPKNLQAVAVLGTLQSAAQQYGVNCIYDFNVFSLLPQGGGYLLKSENGEQLYADKCIIATGGMASPAHSCGTNGYDIAKQIGHSITRLSPALVALKSGDKMVKALKGVRVKSSIALIIDDAVVYRENGEVIFGDGTLSGICVFNASSFVVEKKSDNVKITLDLVPDMDDCALYSYLNGLKLNHCERPCKDFLSGIIHTRLGNEIMKRIFGSCYNPLKPISALETADIKNILGALKSLEFKVTGLSDYKNAQITAGGIPLSEINMQTMESKKSKGIYITGEILNINALCGGFNLHFAWSTGIVAGNAAAENVIYM